MNSLRQEIEEEIRERGPIPFSRYMELCLYHPQHGYYMRDAEQFGKAGDFYTSSDVHAVFGRLLARQFDEVWRILGRPALIDLMELGPGRGLFARDVLDWSEHKFSDFFGALRYSFVESSPALCRRLQSTLARHLESGKAVLLPLDSTNLNAISKARAAEGRQKAAHGAGHASEQYGEPAPKGRKKLPRIAVAIQHTPTIIFANEFFDALPVEILSSKGSLRIAAHDRRFVETWAETSPEEFEFLDRFSVHPKPGERIEAPLVAQQYMDHLAVGVHRGFIIAIDYGYTREKQLAGRHRGTLKAIRQHSVSANPYEAPGEQDITADVNFTSLAAAAQKHGLETQRLVTQSQFLMGIGEANQFGDAFEPCRLPQERAKVALQLKHLVTPAGMGESFHVLIASKGIERDKGSALAGLSFGSRQIPR